MSQSPPIRPFDAVMLNAGDGHWIYVERVGNKDGIPALFLHGGPGSGAQHSHRTLFDPEKHHAILFDQRGAGRSHPYLSTDANTTAHQITDIELIRNFLGIDRWIVVGGSWGSTLALAYAQAHPERVAALVLRAIFLGTSDEVQWAFIDGPKRFRPRLYESFLRPLSQKERNDPLAAYVAHLTNKDPDVYRPAAHVWNAYERALSTLASNISTLPENFDTDARLPPTPIMEAHYIKHNFFLEPDQLLKNTNRIKDIPGTIIQGRYDLLCPPATAKTLIERWPSCQLQIMQNAGHAITEPGVADAMKKAIDDFSATVFHK